MDVFALALALLVFALSIWIVVPGPTLPLFIVTVGATELWPVLTFAGAFAAIVAVRTHERVRTPALLLSGLAILCTLVPPLAYAIAGPYVPLSAFFAPCSPSGRTARKSDNAPVVLDIYGGAWERGSPQNDAGFDACIASWGYRVIALDYPHAPASRWPAQRDAILRQIDAVHAKRVVLPGHSSGAQLAMIAGALGPHRISGIVTYESPVDLKLAYERVSQPDIIHARHVLSDLCGGSPQRDPGCYRSASPRYVVRTGMPPVLLIAGARDHVVTFAYEQLLRDELRGDGVRVRLVKLAWADHAFETVSLGFHNRIAMWYVRRFLDRLDNGLPTTE